MPWNPAKLEQRIARAWRKHQTRPVTVINLVSENTLEHRMLETLSLKQALADTVLERKGNLKELKLVSGRQAFLAKLQQLVTPVSPEAKPAPEIKPTLPADRPRGFADAAHQRINGALVRCEERYPSEGPHSVLYVVVDRDAVQWREKLNALHEDFFGPGKWDPLAPVRIEVIDRATDEALQRLIEAGLVGRTTRASRPLWPAESAGQTPTPLSDLERAKVAAHREQAVRKLKMASLLGGGGLEDEARAALLGVVHPLGCALAIENRLPEPADAQQALISPLSMCWKEALTPLREVVANPAAPWKPAFEALSKV